MMQLCEMSYGDDYAIVLFQELLHRYVARGDRQQIAQLLRQLGQFYESQHRYNLALECYAQALKAVPPEELL
jgi:tetratricopeptide (TPR) repeat protein